ncbi:hypothetical protein [Sphingomonas sp. LHG3406-1]|uniref:hypothetical protein n=1 Tax=Sphingomonas sp. LHG3406-1 TaxID=2804617 RepID=UPI002633ACD8|nr:hypothetical protein [Sphingomonas sp. LHG3406-1]
MPDLTSKPRHDGWTPDVRAAFLEALRDTGKIVAALAAVRRARSGAYALRNRDPAFRAEWDQALLDARPLIDDLLLSRALSGTRTVIVDAEGRVLRTFCETDTRLMQRMLSRLEHLAGVRRVGQRESRGRRA